MVVPSFTIGVLAKPLFALEFVDAALVIIFFNFIGVLTVCFFSPFGATFGLRQMVLSRFWFGWWGVKLSTTGLTSRAVACDTNSSVQLHFSMCWLALDGLLPTSSSVPS